MSTLNISYLTSRKNPCFEWFAESLLNQLDGKYSGVRIIVVDYWSQAIPHYNWTEEDAVARRKHFRNQIHKHNGSIELDVIVTPPKPCSGQGPYRITKNDYFAAANARNTAICYALDGYMTFTDDVSVLLPSWLPAVREHMKNKVIVCGAFRKVKNLKVEHGNVISFENHAGGVDSRWNEGKDDKAIECASNWLFGCSFGAPLERLLEVNGLCEDADSLGLGMEDCALGIALGNRGHKLYYDRRMLTYESEEMHFQEPVMMRVDKKRGGVVSQSMGGHPDEKGHHFVRMFKKAKRFSNYFGEGGIAAMRQRILCGGSFPIAVHPRHDWFDSQPLSEL